MKRILLIIASIVCFAGMAFTIYLRLPDRGESASVEQKVSSVAEEASSEELVAEPTPEPTPEPKVYYNVSIAGKTVSTAIQTLDLSYIKSSDVDEVCSILPELTELEYVYLSGGTEDGSSEATSSAVTNEETESEGSTSTGLTFSDLDKLYAAAPDVLFAYEFTAFDKTINTYDEVLDLNHITMEDEGAQVLEILPYMRNLKTLDMDSCGVSNEAMDSIRQQYPGVEVIWRIWFGTGYTVRTNVTKILASKPSWGGEITNEQVQQLKYCTNLKFLDLGHNENLSDFSFVAYLTDLRVVVVSMAALSDLTPFSNCKELWYMEAGNCDITDLSPLAECTKLEHLNVGTNLDLKDISPLYNLNLKRLWLGIGDPVPTEQVEKMKELHPGIEIDTSVPTGLETDGYGHALNEGFVMGKWKSYKQYLKAEWDYYLEVGTFPAQHPKGVYRIVYDGFNYGDVTYAYAFEFNDPLVNQHASIYEETPLPETGKMADTGSVYYLSSDYENAELWAELAEEYTKQTGTPVTIAFAGESEDDDDETRDVYADALSECIDEVDAPTLFEIGGGEDIEAFGAYCYDLSGTDLVSGLDYDGFTISSEGKVYGTAYNIDAYGILVNKAALAEAGYTVDDLDSFESLKAIVEDISARRTDGEFYLAPFASPDIADHSKSGCTTMLVNVPIAMEFQENGGFSEKLEGTYVSGLQNLWNLIMMNAACSHYDLSPVEYVLKSVENSRSEFAKGEGIMYVGSTDEYDLLVKAGMNPDDIAIIPVYMGVGDEENQGLCVGSDSFWCVNSNASEADINATLDFMNWCVSSSFGLEKLTEMGYTVPYESAPEPENPLMRQALDMISEGKTPVLRYFSAMPTDSWCDEVNYEMAAWAADLGDWNDIYNETVNVWSAEYAVK